MEDVDELLEGPERKENDGIAIRLIYSQEKDHYRVEYSAIMQDGSIEDEWNLFGGTIGYTDSIYEEEEMARQTLEDIKALSGEEILSYFALDTAHNSTEGDNTGN